MEQRLSKIESCIKQAKDLALRSPCVGRRRFGAIIIKDDAIVSAGYNGSVRGSINCGIDIPCIQNLKDAEHNKDYSQCCAVHAEMNAIVNASRLGHAVLGGTLILAEANGKGDRPCFLCRRFIINAGVKDVYYEDKDGIVKYDDVSLYVKMQNDDIIGYFREWGKKSSQFTEECIDTVIADLERKFYPSIDVGTLPLCRQ